MQITKKPRNRRAGFTLFEILIAIALIGLLATLLIANMDKIFGNNQEKIAKIFVTQTMKTALTSYRLDMGTYPTTAQGLQALVTAPSEGAENWKGPYIDTEGGKLPLDPWKHPYQYACPGKHNPQKYDLWSEGDPTKGSGHEIGNW